MSIVREWKVSFFKDEEQTEEIHRVNFGEVWEGAEKAVTVYIRNEENAFIRDLVFKADGLTLEGPITIGINGVSALIIRWNPGIESLALDEDIEISGTAVHR